MSRDRISQAEMTARVTAGTAWPLLSDGVPGPMMLPGGAWWVVPAEGDTTADYQLVPAGAAAERLDRHARRLALAAAAVPRDRHPHA